MIMLPDLPTLAQTSESRLKPLRWLAGELRLYAVEARIMPDHARPSLRADLPGADGHRVSVGRADGQPCYLWDEGAAAHPLFDPAGAARRLAVMLRRERAGR